MAVSDGLQPNVKPTASSTDVPSPVSMEAMSYAEQYDYLVSQPKGSVNFRKPFKKPSLEAQVHLINSLNVCTVYYTEQRQLWPLAQADQLCDLQAKQSDPSHQLLCCLPAYLYRCEHASAHLRFPSLVDHGWAEIWNTSPNTLLLFQAADSRSWRIPFSNVYTQTKHAARYYHHWGTTLFMIWIHGMCLLGPATYNPVLALVTVPIIITFGLGIEMVYHRMLCHKAFSSPKWWEYTMAYFGILNIQVRRLL